MRLEDYRAGQIAYLVYVSTTSPESRQLELADFMPTIPRATEQADDIDWESRAAEMRLMTEGTYEGH